MRTITLNNNYAGWLEGVSPYSCIEHKIQVGEPGDKVKIVSEWIDDGIHWLLVETEGVQGWILIEETN